MQEKFKLVFEHEIEISFSDAAKDTYKANVDMVNETSIVINTPLVKGKPLSLEPGTEVNVIYTDQLAIYGFSCVIKSVFGKPEYKFIVSIPTEVNRTQRRNFVRVDVDLYMTFFTGSDDCHDVKTYNTKTRDLSGGGLRFDFDSKLPIGTTLDILLEIPTSGSESSKVTAMGRVVRCLPIGHGPGEKFSIGVEFMVIEKQEREAIIRYLFEYQRQLRKKGIL